MVCYGAACQSKSASNVIQGQRPSELPIKFCRAVHVHLSVLERGQSLFGVANVRTMRVFQWSEQILPFTPWQFQDACQGFLSYRDTGQGSGKSQQYLKKHTELWILYSKSTHGAKFSTWLCLILFA